MKEFRIMAYEPNMPMPMIFYILAREIEEAKRMWYLRHPGWFIYSIEQVQPF